ncbi:MULTISPECIES: phenylalanine--tRNA ligase subunit beta [unclassified Polaromonas]|jgi:phenylalanyl-tRNA synthetase beta chain|uniref:phenylalanine--tRNA ligase subunit beta n=1 Tax=unclassified Polaromonas TaxID=2638319 RepID=UPI000BCE40E6|nr:MULTISPECIES: phenylalanine--tRNA ligase subunit beta [unclassified Polaromonas]OYY35013.1 MAG: phenylalanine--tRNA ligase subunit beta [Polaromonas sp. 35-63-35]OYZ20153.1 MAG: phenylalanine--tRNA ligase subunit beta [Polaromonas sp. 16-63-31]OYZ77908.1 MAG: phenylalanine--tRNA ligase subunit beta [Polaromonas sp. 24-63-21]OZA49417.1 MAG: phenylalanine--tRNA ligase subunit beta [Polaromonas sp. 17-63-33]OZA87448.1 MAG: phenylalanine--tRNA ligase subunit beta [Polaromonas sp. 39-63-25]
MQFPESWLREFCNPSLSTEQLAETLTMAGLEVEDLQPVAPPFSKIVVGEIREAVQHPDADRLRVCQVDVGQGVLLNIVCGAPNARVGIKVPCALVGAELPPGDDGKPFLIKVGKLRGVESQGMLCSARELKLSDDHGGLLELAPDAPVGQDIREHLKLDDTLFTLKLTPNLAHCLSVYGIAREVAALTGAPLVSPSFPAVAVANPDKLPVRISAPDLCGRFSGRIVRNVNTKAATPAWMVDRLARCGQRSVTALVDISNYVMFELGRPSHIFDLDKIHGGLDVRWGQAGETLKLLNGTTVTVDDKVGVIADDNQVESLAGIMGGDATAVSDDTKHVYVEAAFWWPKAIAGRSRRYNFSTDAGHRFERGVDPGQTVEHIERITQLILDICGTPDMVCGPIDDVQANLPKAEPVTLRVARAAKVIGMPLTQAQCADALRRLGLPVSEGEGTLTVTPPSYRFDLQIEEDLIEEVVRMVGYQQLPATPPLAPITARIRPEARRSAFAVRRALAALGYQETINFSFVEERWEHELAGNPNPIKLLNPIASQMSVMRSSLIGSLLQVLKFNLDRKAGRVNVFELGRVFLRDARSQNTDTTVAGFDQPMRVAGLAYGPRETLQWSTSDKGVDFFDVKGDVQALLAPLQAVFAPAAHPAMHPGRCASVAIDGVSVGFVGELHPQWRQGYELAQAPIVFELALDAVLRRPVPGFQPVSKRQPVERDIAVIVAEAVTHAALMAAIHGADTRGLLKSATLFDIYRPQQANAAMQLGEKSLAVRLVLGSDDATLTDEQIEAAIKAVLDNLGTSLQARLRA